MVNMLTQQIGAVFNPLIQQIHNSYETLTNQMGRIADFFGAPPTQNRPMPQNQNERPVQIPVEILNNLLSNHNHKRILRGSQSWSKGTKMLIK